MGQQGGGDAPHGPGKGSSAGFGAGPSVLLEHPLALRFVGSGSEYFRIWIVNLLLTLLTLGLYYPYAKLRRLRYFFGATEVGGQPLSFHARGSSMYVGYGLVLVLGLVYSVAGKLSATAGALAFVIVALIWPALWHSALRFRLFNTGWRGLRFGFDGTRGGAYLALWPVLLLLGPAIFAALLAGADATPAPAADAAASGNGWQALAVLLPLLLTLVVLLVLAPAVLWRMRRYQHNHYQLASETTQFAVRLRSFYALALRLLGLCIVALLLAVGAAALLLYGVQAGAADDEQAQRVAFAVRGLVAALIGMLLLQALLRPYLTARLQNLVWNGTRSHNLRFHSSLRVRALLWLTLKNWLLMVVTLGFYFPFAAVAVARLRLQAVTVVTTLDPDAFVAQAGPRTEAAAGDAAGDLFGLDVGL